LEFKPKSAAFLRCKPHPKKAQFSALLKIDLSQQLVIYIQIYWPTFCLFFISRIFECIRVEAVRLNFDVLKQASVRALLKPYSDNPSRDVEREVTGRIDKNSTVYQLSLFSFHLIFFVWFQQFSFFTYKKVNQTWMKTRRKNMSKTLTQTKMQLSFAIRFGRAS